MRSAEAPQIKDRKPGYKTRRGKMLPSRLTLNASEFGHLPLRERLAKFKKVGFSTIETGTCPEIGEKEFNDYCSLIREYGLKAPVVHDWYHFFSPTAPDEIREVTARFLQNLERARAMGADKLIWYTGSNPDCSGEEAVKWLLDRLQPVLARAASLGVIILLESEFCEDGRDPSSSVTFIESLLNKADNPFLRINFDPANTYVAGEEPFPFAYGRLKKWIRHVHLKDVFLYHPESYPEGAPGHLQKGKDRAGICCPLGAGAVNTWGLLQALKKDGYKDYLSLELLP